MALPAVKLRFILHKSATVGHSVLIYDSESYYLTVVSFIFILLTFDHVESLYFPTWDYFVSENCLLALQTFHFGHFEEEFFLSRFQNHFQILICRPGLQRSSCA